MKCNLNQGTLMISAKQINERPELAVHIKNVTPDILYVLWRNQQALDWYFLASEEMRDLVKF